MKNELSAHVANTAIHSAAKLADQDAVAALQATLDFLARRIPGSSWDLLHWDEHGFCRFLLGQLACPHPELRRLDEDNGLPPFVLTRSADGKDPVQLQLPFEKSSNAAVSVDWLWPLGKRGRAPWICGRLLQIRIDELKERRAWLSPLFAELRRKWSGSRNDSEDGSCQRLGILYHEDSPIDGLLEQVAALAPTETPVFLQGESGVGKELFAQALHHLSPRKTGTFVAQNGGALTDTLIESELFGHSRGSFTGARDERVGLFELANGGTFFLDEVGDLSAMLQVRLLRVLQDRQIRRVGENRLRPVDFRLVSATHHDMEECVRGGRFRLDLWFRIQGVRLRIPPLRERSMDIPVLARAFLRERAVALGLAMRELSEEAVDALLHYSWPGNVRELQNEMARIVAFYGEMPTLERWMLSDALFGERPGELPASLAGLTLQAAQADLERRMIRQTLGRFGGNRSRSARALGLSRQGLLKKLKRLGMERVALKPRHAS